MKIQEIHIQSYGALQDYVLRLGEGVTVLEGPNESGKTTVAAFIKYIFYGPAQKGSVERARYLRGVRSGGWLTAKDAHGTIWRIERMTIREGDDSRESLRDSVQIVNTRTNTVLPEKHPGEYFFGVNESVFTSTAFVDQIGGARPDGKSLSGAVENMLQSADENVDLKKAADRLNQARRELLPKNTTGGRIRELEEEQSRLTEALAAARERYDKATASEDAMQNAARKSGELEEKKEQLDQLAEACEVIALCKKLAAVEDATNKLKGYKNAWDVLNAPPYSDLDKQLDALDGKDPPEEKAEPEAFQTGTHLRLRNEEAAEALEEGEYLESKARLFLAVAITMVIAGLAALGAGIIMVYFGFAANQFVIPFGIMGVFVILGIVCYVLQGKYIRQLNDILDDWNVESLDELDELAEEGAAHPTVHPAPKPEKHTADTSGDREVKLRILAEACGLDPEEDGDALYDALRKKADKAAADRDAVRAKIEKLTGRLEALKEETDNLDRPALVARYKQIIATEVGKAAAKMDAAAADRVRKERDMTAAAWQIQSKKEGELREAHAALGTGDGRTPDMLETQLQRVTDELEEAKKQHAAYSLALEAMENAGQNLRTTVIPTVTGRASAAMNKATGGKYGSIAMDPSFGLRFEGKTGSDSVEVLSKGTADLAYVSLRLALARTLFGENGKEVPPMIFDETFAAVDCQRLEMAMEAMQETGLQCLLCSCRGDESRIAMEKGCPVVQL